MMLPATGDPIRVLVIEDNPADVELLRLAFQEAHFDCALTVINDGEEALSMFRNPVGNDVAELAVLDMNLPRYDGIEILQAARASSAFAHIPVAVLSSGSSPREQSRLPAYGPVCYITKPPDLDAFLGIGVVIREFFSAHRSSSASA